MNQHKPLSKTAKEICQNKSGGNVQNVQAIFQGGFH
jgi:hypothetical protein